MHFAYRLALCVTQLIAVGAWADEGKHRPLNPQYMQECGSCHVAYPPGLLGEASWRPLMAGLDKHFGNDASVDATTRGAIERYLLANAATRPRLDSQGKPPLRITASSWFKREHDEVTPAVWQRASIKSPANCAACHSQAEQGSYSERQIRIPGQ